MRKIWLRKSSILWPIIILLFLQSSSDINKKYYHFISSFASKKQMQELDPEKLGPQIDLKNASPNHIIYKHKLLDFLFDKAIAQNDIPKGTLLLVEHLVDGTREEVLKVLKKSSVLWDSLIKRDEPPSLVHEDPRSTSRITHRGFLAFEKEEPDEAKTIAMRKYKRYAYESNGHAMLGEYAAMFLYVDKPKFQIGRNNATCTLINSINTQDEAKMKRFASYAYIYSNTYIKKGEHIIINKGSDCASNVTLNEKEEQLVTMLAYKMIFKYILTGTAIMVFGKAYELKHGTELEAITGKSVMGGIELIKASVIDKHNNMLFGMV